METKTLTIYQTDKRDKKNVHLQPHPHLHLSINWRMAKVSRSVTGAIQLNRQCQNSLGSRRLVVLRPLRSLGARRLV